MNWGKWIQQALVYLDSHCAVNALPEWVLTLTVEKICILFSISGTF